MKKFVMLMMGFVVLMMVGCGSSGGTSTTGAYTPIGSAPATEEPQTADTVIVSGNSGAFTYISNGDGTVILSGDIDIQNAEPADEATALATGGVAANADGTCNEGFHLLPCGVCYPDA